MTMKNRSSTSTISAGSGASQSPDVEKWYLSNPETMRQVYGFYHLMCVFWIPAVIILISYLSLSIWLMRSAGTTTSNSRHHKMAGAMRQQRGSTSYGCSNTSYYTTTYAPLSTNGASTAHKDYHQIPVANGSHLTVEKWTSPTVPRDPLQTPQAAKEASDADTVTHTGRENGEFSPTAGRTTETTTPTTTKAPTNYKESKTCGTLVSFRTMSTELQSQSLVANLNDVKILRAKRKAQRKARSTALRVSFLLVAAYIICWLPYNSLLIWQFLSPTTYEKYEYVSYWLNGLIVLNSVINPYLYGTFGEVHRYARNA